MRTETNEKPVTREKTLVKSDGARVGLKDVASLANVSVATVSMALSDHSEISEVTKRRIRRFCDQIGYRPRGQSGTGAVSKPVRPWKRLGFLEVGMGLDDPTCQTFLQELSRFCAQQDIALQLASVDDVALLDQAPARGLSLAQDVDGLLLSGTVDANMIGVLRDRGVPFVVLGHTMLSPQQANDTIVHTVASDEYAMGHAATLAMIRAGHKRIGFISEVFISGLSHWRWRSGYLAALADSQLSANPAYFHATGFGPTDGTQAVDHFLKLERSNSPTAYVIPDARIAKSFFILMRDRGREISSSDIVLAVDELHVAKHGLTDWKRIEYDHRGYVRLGLQQLRLLTTTQTIAASTTTWVPFKCVNLPA